MYKRVYLIDVIELTSWRAGRKLIGLNYYQRNLFSSNEKKTHNTFVCLWISHMPNNKWMKSNTFSYEYFVAHRSLETFFYFYACSLIRCTKWNFGVSREREREICKLWTTMFIHAKTIWLLYYMRGHSMKG